MSRWAPEIKVFSRRNPRKNPKPPPDPSSDPAPAPEPSPKSNLAPEPSPKSNLAPEPSPNSNPPPEPSPKSSPPPEPSPKSSPPPEPSSNPNPDPLAQTLASFRRSIRRSEAEVAAPPPDPASPSHPHAEQDGAALPNGHGGVQAAAADEKARKRRERSDLRRQLASELDQVRVLSKRLKAAGEALAAEASQHAPLAVDPPPLQLTAGYGHPQFSGGGPLTPVPPQLTAPVPSVRSFLPRRLIVPEVHTEPLEKEKRTPKANQLYQNSEFLLAKDRIPASDPHGRKKAKHHKKRHRSSAASYNAEQRLYAHPFKKSSSLLSRLMKHKFGWVFNKPVDPVALGLHDYFTIIKHPMDLGTIKAQLTRGQYRNPKEFANDVRLTFHNAMTYNPKGQDVHFMAEQLLGIFEAQWPEIEAEVDYLASCPPMQKKFPPPPLDLRLLERSDSIRHQMALDSKSRPLSHTPTYAARTPSLKKPKAKDLNKRDMTIDEKRKLSNNLQNLPPEKLDVIVQIIKNKNLSVRQHEDEIEVEIDSMDAETLWELDRFVANFKKNLSKQKRKAERAMLAKQDVELRALHAAQQPSHQPTIGEKSPKLNLMATEQLATSVPEQNNNGPTASKSSSSSSSSSDSDSSSSDSDSDSSSTDGSNAANSS
ncbi:hypothetical protein QYE76_022068 [Lolium multiflorum]|uniref:Transcription factor GTE4 n=1 Tax=Lolium multiflorum TaxID=4521 RepID=A0AAD8VSU2_LOLMU|nr:hypothetical protein QYE76_022068 [Lolium multiflorum]